MGLEEKELGLEDKVGSREPRGEGLVWFSLVWLWRLMFAFVQERMCKACKVSSHSFVY